MEKQTNTNFRRFCATTGGRMGERERKHSCCPGFRADPFRQTFLRVDERLPEALPYLFAIFAPFAVRIYNGHSLSEEGKSYALRISCSIPFLTLGLVEPGLG